MIPGSSYKNNVVSIIGRVRDDLRFCVQSPSIVELVDQHHADTDEHADANVCLGHTDSLSSLYYLVICYRSLFSLAK
jgi:hypothetical protein